jgi:hypothetical protein
MGVVPEKVELFLRRSTLTQDWESRELERRTLPSLNGIPEEFHHYWRAFSEELSKQLPPPRNPDMSITLVPDAPKSHKCRPYAHSRKEVSPIFFIAKGSDEKWVIMDYRWLNLYTVKDQNLMVQIGDVMEGLQGYSVFSKFNLRHGYNNIWIQEEDRYKAAIQTRHGTYIPKVMYFGLCNALPFFQRIIRRDFQEFLDKYKDRKEGRGGQYMDDFWMASTGMKEGLALHREMIHCFLSLCKKNHYYLKVTKCEVMQPQMALLGWLITGEGLWIDPAKVTGISEWPTTLRNVKEVRKTMGVLGYQRPFIPGFANRAKIITELTKKGVSFVWTEKHREALKGLIELITTAPILVYPDLENPFELEVDASAFAVGAILFQRDDKRCKRDVGYYSKALNSAERNYDIWDQEFLAVITTLKHWRHLLIGTSHKIIVWTDHQNLQYYWQPQKVNRRVAQGISFMANFPLELQHIAGKKNRANPLSRCPDYDDGSNDNEGTVALPEAMFGRIIEATALDQMVEDEQANHSKLLQSWEKTHNL